MRIGIEKSNYLSECILEFEVLQEFSNSASAAKAGVVGGGVEKTTLGIVKVNLSEYVEESEAFLRVSRRASYAGSERGGPVVDRPLTTAPTNTHSRKHSSLSLGGSTIGGDSFLSKSTASGASLQEETTLDANTPTTPASSKPLVPDVEEGVIRRYLMQNSKINSTLKVGILMIQLDGERNYVAPALKTAPVFGGIAGLMAGGQGTTGEPLEPQTELPPGEAASSGVATTTDPSIAGKSRDIYEIQDMYRRALAASWASQPGEIPADECIEDIFGGGDGFRSGTSNTSKSHNHNAEAKVALGVTSKTSSPNHPPSSTTTTSHSRWGVPKSAHTKKSSPDSHNSHSPSDDDLPGGSTLRPRDLARIKHHIHQATAHFHHSDNNRKETTTTAFPAFKDPLSGTEQQQHYQPRQNPGGLQFLHQQHNHRRDASREVVNRKRSDSLASLATTLGSSTDRGRRGDVGFKKPREVDEFEVREDLVAWTMPGGVVS